MKQLIKKMFEKAGYKLVRTTSEMGLIREMEALFQEFVFKDFPPFDEQRIGLIARLFGTGVSEALYICYYLQRALKIEGDICEFGVAQGRTSALMAYEIRNTEKNIWLFDSFKGLPQPSIHDQLKDDIFNLGSIEKYAGKMACTARMVRNELKRISFPETRAKVVPGFIEETIHYPQLPAQVCFAYVDFDFYEPIKVALNFLAKTLQKNGVIVVDDYDFFSTGAKRAVDEFVSEYQNRYKFFLPVKGSEGFCVLEKVA